MKSRHALSAVALAALMAGTAPAWAGHHDLFYGGSEHAVARHWTGEDRAFSFSFLSAPHGGAFFRDILLDNGSGRLTDGETASWPIAGAFDGHARRHFNSFVDDQSVKLASPVPEPESYVMALVALGVLGAYRRFARGRT